MNMTPLTDTARLTDRDATQALQDAFLMHTLGVPFEKFNDNDTLRRKDPEFADKSDDYLNEFRRQVKSRLAALQEGMA
jgi:hypothetical protein